MRPPRPKHGLSGHPAYNVWKKMRSRCNNQRDEHYALYGARGIRVCARWDSFAAFIADMGPRPPGATIERNDNDRGYDPGNCRWATRAEQSRNRRHLRYYTHDGRTMCIAAWAQEVGLNPCTLRARLDSGWPFAVALFGTAELRAAKLRQADEILRQKLSIAMNDIELLVPSLRHLLGTTPS